MGTVFEIALSLPVPVLIIRQRRSFVNNACNDVALHLQSELGMFSEYIMARILA